MTPGAQETSVRTQIVVAAPIERAFRVFTEEFDRIKPREHNLLGVEIAETVFGPRVGGHVYDRGVDGSECRWARLLAYEPPHRVVISWDISPQWRIENSDAGDSRDGDGATTGVVRRVRRFYPTMGDRFIRWADLDRRWMAGDPRQTIVKVA